MTETNNKEILKKTCQEFQALLESEGTPALQDKWEEVKEAISLCLGGSFNGTGKSPDRD